MQTRTQSVVIARTSRRLERIRFARFGSVFFYSSMMIDLRCLCEGLCFYPLFTRNSICYPSVGQTHRLFEQVTQRWPRGSVLCVCVCMSLQLLNARHHEQSCVVSSEQLMKSRGFPYHL